jgi:hypothetical protein
MYNTRGDKGNDSTAKYAYSETKEQGFQSRRAAVRLLRELMGITDDGEI